MQAHGSSGSRAINFCLVGAGFIGPVHAANVTAHPRARLRWVVDLNAEAARRVATKHGAQSATSADAALADAAVDAVIICTPPRTHAPLIAAAARAGKAVFCEKPVDLDMKPVMDCAKILAATRTPFFVGFNRRFDPNHRALFDAMGNGEIGRPEMLILSSRDPEIAPPDYIATMSHAIFYDTMIHDFDMARWLLQDEPVEIFARTARMLDAKDNPHRTPDTAMVILRMARGALVHVNASFRAAYGYDQRIEAFGEKGMIVSRNPQPTTLERYGADGIRQDRLLHFFVDRYADSYVRELDAFVQALERGTVPSIGIEDGRRALMIAEAAMRSAESGAPIRLAPGPPQPSD
ncbi:MAG: inositol 2-dehydrogenase [Proteobacteria bacterium]|nr:inositol 2-dehydrogenase [Pseudomonadota bacterium]